MINKIFILAANPGQEMLERFRRKGARIISAHPVLIAEGIADPISCDFDRNAWQSIDNDCKYAWSSALKNIRGLSEETTRLEGFLLLRKILFEMRLAEAAGAARPSTAIFIQELGLIRPWSAGFGIGLLFKTARHILAGIASEVARLLSPRMKRLPREKVSEHLFCLEKIQRDSVSLAFRRLLASPASPADFSLLCLKPVKETGALSAVFGRAPSSILSPWYIRPGISDLARFFGFSWSLALRSLSNALHRRPLSALAVLLSSQAVMRNLPLMARRSAAEIRSLGARYTVVATERHTSSALFLDSWRAVGGEFKLIQHGVLAELETNRQANFPSRAGEIFCWGQESGESYLKHGARPRRFTHLPPFRERPNTNSPAPEKYCRICYMGQNFHYSKGKALYQCFLTAVSGLDTDTFRIAVRPHGAKSMDAGASFYRAITPPEVGARLKISAEGTADEEIQRSDIVVTSTSTTYIEALLHHKHVILIDIDLDSPPAMGEFAAGKIVKSPAELRRAIESMAAITPNAENIRRYLDYACLGEIKSLEGFPSN